MLINFGMCKNKNSVVHTLSYTNVHTYTYIYMDINKSTHTAIYTPYTKKTYIYAKEDSQIYTSTFAIMHAHIVKYLMRMRVCKCVRMCVCESA